MKMITRNTAELLPLELDYAAAQAIDLGEELEIVRYPTDDGEPASFLRVAGSKGIDLSYSPSRVWSSGGSLMMDHVHDLRRCETDNDCQHTTGWVATGMRDGSHELFSAHGDTALIATTRLAVSILSGHAVEVPEHIHAAAMEAAQ